MTYIPTMEYRIFEDALYRANKRCYPKSDGGMYCKCDHEDLNTGWPTFKLQVEGDIWIFMMGQDYLKTMRRNECLLMINEEIGMIESEHYMLLGDNFLRGYYSIFDIEN